VVARGGKLAPGRGGTDRVELDALLRSSWLVSSDSHVVEPPDLWSGRGGALAARMPRVVSEPDGDWWYVDGRKTMSFLGIQTGDRFVKDRDELRTSGAFGDVRPAAYDPARYLAENETDGVWGSVLYPSQGLVLYGVPATDVVSASMKAYNEWLAEFCRHDPGRLKGVAMVNVDDVDDAVRELARCRALGLCGALVTVLPPRWQPFRSPVYDRLWAAAQDLDLPLSLHVATDRADVRAGDAAFTLDVKAVPPSAFVNKDHQIRQTLADLIFSGVFERFPRLRVGSIEHELAWIPFFLEQMDYTYTQRPPRGPEWIRFRDRGALPSDFFRRNVFASFQEDRVGLAVRGEIGVDALLWGSDYPHTEATFPRSREVLARVLAGVAPEEAARIVSGNCARLYGFDVPKAAPRAGRA
jgi:predicted TIM-barrel fold metal-dependent hydrolase